MCAGDVRELQIPPELGYGAKRKSSIPPNTVLHFQITMLAVLPTHNSSYLLADEIQKCTAGSAWVYTAGACMPCPAGQHQPRSGQIGCSVCGQGQVSAAGQTECAPGPETALSKGGPGFKLAEPPAATRNATTAQSNKAESHVSGW